MYKIIQDETQMYLKSINQQHVDNKLHIHIITTPKADQWYKLRDRRYSKTLPKRSLYLWHKHNLNL